MIVSRKTLRLISKAITAAIVTMVWSGIIVLLSYTVLNTIRF
jgi:hypothetical protein